MGIEPTPTRRGRPCLADRCGEANIRLLSSRLTLIRYNRRNSFMTKCFDHGADETRTRDLLVANEALSQLSYSPNMRAREGFEPSTDPDS